MFKKIFKIFYCSVITLSVLTLVCSSVFAGSVTGGIKEVPATKIKAGQIIKRDVEITVPVYISEWNEEEWQKKGGMRYLLDTTCLFREGDEPAGPGASGLVFAYLYAIERFQYAYPEYRVLPTYWGPQETEKLMSMLAAGEAPSCFPADWLGGLTTCVDKKAAADLTDFWKVWPQADKIPERIRVEAQRKGRYYGFPFYSGAWDTALTYRWPWLADAGIFDEEGNPAPPKDWTYLDYAKILQKITNPKKKKWGTAIALGGTGFQMSNPYNYLWEYSFAVPRVLPDPSGKNTYVSGLDTKASKELMQFCHDLVWKYKAALWGTDIDNQKVCDLFTNDSICFGRYNAASWAARHTIAFSGKDLVQRRNGVMTKVSRRDVMRTVPLPRGPHGTRLNTITGGTYWVINPYQTKEQIQATFEWLNWYEVIMGREVHNQMRDTDSRLTRKILSERLPALKAGKRPEIYLPEKRPTPTLIAPCIYPRAGVKPWIEQMKILPGAAETRKITMTDPMKPLLLAYGLTISNEKSMMNLMETAVEEAVVNEDADINAITKKYVDLINRGPLHYKDKSITTEKLKAYWTAVMDFYKKNFPDYYEANSELWKRVKVW